MPTAPEALPADYRRARPCVIGLDNYAVHRSTVVKELLPALAAAGVTFFNLPPYAPALNAIEPLWRHIKYDDLPVRSFSDAEALKAAVESVLDAHIQRVAQSTISLCEAA